MNWQIGDLTSIEGFPSAQTLSTVDGPLAIGYRLAFSDSPLNGDVIAVGLANSMLSDANKTLCFTELAKLIPAA